MRYAIIGFLIWNLIVFGVYGLDKFKAIKGLYRVPEKVLLSMALCFGGLGAYIGMSVFRHKTKHTSFNIVVPACMFIQIFLLLRLFKQ